VAGRLAGRSGSQEAIIDTDNSSTIAIAKVSRFMDPHFLFRLLRISAITIVPNQYIFKYTGMIPA